MALGSPYAALAQAYPSAPSSADNTANNADAEIKSPENNTNPEADAAAPSQAEAPTADQQRQAMIDKMKSMGLDPNNPQDIAAVNKMDSNFRKRQEIAGLNADLRQQAGVDDKPEAGSNAPNQQQPSAAAEANGDKPSSQAAAANGAESKEPLTAPQQRQAMIDKMISMGLDPNNPDHIAAVNKDDAAFNKRKELAAINAELRQQAGIDDKPEADSTTGNQQQANAGANEEKPNTQAAAPANDPSEAKVPSAEASSNKPAAETVSARVDAHESKPSQLSGPMVVTRDSTDFLKAPAMHAGAMQPSVSKYQSLNA